MSQPLIPTDEQSGFADAHRDDGRRFIVHADEMLTAFVELERQALTMTFYLNPSMAIRLRLMTIVEITPHRWGWKVSEAPGVEPVFPSKDDAISYATARARFRTGQIRVLDASGNVERAITFNESDRKL